MDSNRRSHWVGPLVGFLLFLAPVAGVSAGDETGSGKHSSNAALFSSDAYLDHIAYLASDELEGRGTGQEALDVAANYIAGAFEQLGLEPAGDDGTYFQTFTLPMKNEIGENTRLAMALRGRRTWRSLSLEKDYIPFPFSGSGEFKGEVVFAGYGIASTRDGINYDDYANLDVAGKVVLLLDYSPEFTHFSRRETSFRGKAQQAIDRDAVAVLIVTPDDDDEEAELFDFYGRKVPVFGMASHPFDIPMFNIRREVADRMLRSADMPSIQELSDRIEETKGPVSAPLEGVTIKGCADVRIGESDVHNVIGLISGAGPQADEYIVLGAHYDHHGIRNKGMDCFNPERDIYNGADDNASGVAMLMTLGKVFTEGPKPNRSILFIAFTAEELGLYGSDHFVHAPTVDLEQCVAMLNFDMVGRLYKDRLQIPGIRTGEFEDMTKRLAKRYALKLVDGGGAQGGSDQSSFHDQGIPVMFFHTGIHKQYTQPGDDTERINAAGAVRIAKFAADCIDEIDANPGRPPFHRDGSHAPLMRTGDEDVQGQRIAEYFHRLQKRRAFLGVKRSENADEPGFLVSEVMSGMAAERAGVLAGDRIVRLGDVDVQEPADLVRAVQQHHKGDETTVVLERDGEEHRLPVHFGEAEEPVSVTVSMSASADSDRGESKRIAKRVRLGVRVKDDEEPGLLITEVLRDTPARWAGLEKGDRVVKLGDATISTRADLAAALAGFKPGDETQVRVSRGAEESVLGLRFGPSVSRHFARGELLDWVLRLDKLAAGSAPDAERRIWIESKGLRLDSTGDAEVLVDAYLTYASQHGNTLKDDVTIGAETLDGGDGLKVSVSVTLPVQLLRGQSKD